MKKLLLIVGLIVMLLLAGCGAENPAIEEPVVEDPAIEEEPEDEFLLIMRLESLNSMLETDIECLDYALELYEEAQAKGDKEEIDRAALAVIVLYKKVEERMEEIEQLEQQIERIRQ